MLNKFFIRCDFYACNLLLQKATVFIGEPMDFTDQLNELRAARKSDVSVKLPSLREKANARVMSL